MRILQHVTPKRDFLGDNVYDLLHSIFTSKRLSRKAFHVQSLLLSVRDLPVHHRESCWVCGGPIPARGHSSLRVFSCRSSLSLSTSSFSLSASPMVLSPSSCSQTSPSAWPVVPGRCCGLGGRGPWTLLRRPRCRSPRLSQVASSARFSAEPGAGRALCL